MAIHGLNCRCPNSDPEGWSFCCTKFYKIRRARICETEAIPLSLNGTLVKLNKWSMCANADYLRICTNQALSKRKVISAFTYLCIARIVGVHICGHRQLASTSHCSTGMAATVLLLWLTKWASPYLPNSLCILLCFHRAPVGFCWLTPVGTFY